MDRTTQKLVIMPVDDEGSAVFVDAVKVRRFDTGAEYESVNIVTANGTAEMSRRQWNEMISMGRTYND